MNSESSADDALSVPNAELQTTMVSNARMCPRKEPPHMSDFSVLVRIQFLAYPRSVKTFSNPQGC
jgi:hypothetical protein